MLKANRTRGVESCKKDFDFFSFDYDEEKKLTSTKIAKKLKGCSKTVSSVLAKKGISISKKTGENHPNWRGGRVNTEQGYIQVIVDINDHISVETAAIGAFYVLEHRLVMARFLGRPLERHETVHHINGIKNDNRIENLQLRQGKHGKGVVYCCLNCVSNNVKSVKLK